MTIEEIVDLTKNKIKHLLISRELAFSRGDIEIVANIDDSLLITRETLSRLETLLPS
jgi:hypothetical protein